MSKALSQFTSNLSKALTTDTDKVLTQLNMASVVVPVLALLLSHNMTPPQPNMETLEQADQRKAIYGLSITTLVVGALLVVAVPHLNNRGNWAHWLNLGYFALVIVLAITTLDYISKNKGVGTPPTQNLSMIVQAAFWVFLAGASYKGLGVVSTAVLGAGPQANTNQLVA